MKNRKEYIGGSDCAAILGLSRWSTPLKVWAEKTGNIEPKDISDRLEVELGNYLEDFVAKKFEKKTGKKVRRVKEAITHKDHDFIKVHIDRRVVGEDTILECKTCSAWKAKEWEGEEIPQEYILQTMHSLGVTGAKMAYVAILIGNSDFKYKPVYRNEKLIADIIKKENSFWKDFVLTGIMPMQITKSDAETLYSLFPAEEIGKEIELKDDASKLFEQRQALLQDKKNVTNMLAKTDNEIKALLQDAERGIVGKWVATWKKQATTRIDTARVKEENPDLYEKFSKTTESRVLRVKELKEIK
jgi:putative phage-type endonuclease